MHPPFRYYGTVSRYCLSAFELWNRKPVITGGTQIGQLAGSQVSVQINKTVQSNVGYLTQPGSDSALYFPERGCLGPWVQLSTIAATWESWESVNTSAGGRHVSAIARILSYDAGEKIRLSGEAAH
jgi:hypothetical protein